jgi:hypothetical protein
MRGPRSARLRRHVPEAGRVVGTPPGHLPGIDGRLGLVGPDNPHPLRRRGLREPVVLTVVAVLHWCLLSLGLLIGLLIRPADAPGSDGEQLLFFVLEHAIDLGYVIVGDLVQLLFGSVELVR